MSWALWLTGLPGSGKSTVARAAAAALRAAGEPVVLLELDAIRRVVTPAPSYSDAERDLVYRALVWMAAVLAEAGRPVLIDATAHRREWRDLARACIANFGEVQLLCPLEVCRAREAARAPGAAPPGIYARAGRPGATVPGVDLPYEPPLDPELTIRTDVESVEDAARRVVALARRLDGPVRPAAPEAWAIWLTGPPGSGKTTLASRLVEALAGRGIAATVLEWAELRALTLGAGPAPEAREALVHRALACAAAVLTAAGIPVVVDATAPRRAWRDLARRLVPRFAEVQLRCPPAVCRERERAARWSRLACRLHGHGKQAPALDAELVAQYEPALSPELTLHTDVCSEWIATEELLALADRLQRSGDRRATCKSES